MQEITSYKLSNSKFDTPTEMASNMYHKSDEIPELSSHHMADYDEDQFYKDEPITNNLIELELARLRVTQKKKLN